LIPMNIKAHLNANDVVYLHHAHARRFTSPEVADALDMTGKIYAKTLVVMIDGDLLLVAVPANKRLDIEKLSRLTVERFPLVRWGPCHLWETFSTYGCGSTSRSCATRLSRSTPGPTPIRSKWVSKTSVASCVPGSRSSPRTTDPSGPPSCERTHPTRRAPKRILGLRRIVLLRDSSREDSLRT
jgi:hypothetical protein